MSLPADYHMHTPLCRHATGEPTELAAQAIAHGLQEIGFSEHMPMPRDDFDDWHMFFSDLDDYIARVEKARRDHPELAILIGLEMDYIPGLEDWIQQICQIHPWDYLIGSVHYVSGGWDLDNPTRLDEWKRRDIWDVWTDYFSRLTQCVESGFFQIIGHTDLCKKFNFRPKQDPAPLYRQVLKAASKRQMPMELNTAGLRKACREIYPSRAIVEAAFELGVPITFGSDAHAKQEVGAAFEEAVALARSVGYTHWTRFRQRRAESVPL